MSTLQNTPADRQPPTLGRSRFGWKHLLILCGGVTLLLVVCVALLAWYANTAQFQERVRRQVIATVEQTTGGRVELKLFRWRLLHLDVEAQDLTIHGLEAGGEIPYAHIDRLHVRAKILAFFQPKIGLSLLSVQHPVFHLIVYPDGSTNQPQPKTVRNGKSLGDTLFDLAVDRVEIADGLAIINERKIPFDLSARNLGATVTYSAAVAGKDRYLANVTVADLMGHLGKEPPVHSELAMSLSLGRNTAELKSLALRTGSSLLQASGEVENFADPRWRLALTGKVDVREVEALTEVEGLVGGIVDLRIKGQGQGASGFLVEGNAIVDKATYKTVDVNLAGVDLTSRIRATEQQLKLTDIVARLQDGGMVQGAFQLENWLTQTAPQSTTHVVQSAKQARESAAGGRTGASPLQAAKVARVKATARARITGITLRSLLAATAPRRYQDIGFDTAASGPVSVDWTGGGEDFSLDAQLTLVPARAASGRNALPEVPVSGVLDAEYFQHRGSVIIRKLEVQTPATRLTVQGALGVYPESRTSSLQGDVITSNLAEFDRTLAAAGLVSHGKKGVQALPIELQGEAEFHGKVTGTIYEPTVNGHLTATNFATLIPEPTSPATVSSSAVLTNGTQTPIVIPSQRKMQWDRLDATGEYSLDQITIQQATITRGKTQVHAAGLVRPHRINLHRADFDEKSAINATLKVDEASVTEMLDIAGQQLPVTGTLSLDMHAGGTFDNLSGGGHVGVKGGEIYGEPYRSVVADIRFAGRELDVTKLTLLENGGQVVADGAYDLGHKSFRANARGTGFELSHIQRLQRPNSTTSGRVEFDAQGTGTLDNPSVQGNFHLYNLELGGQLLGNVNAEAHTSHRALLYSAESHLEKAALKITGQTELKGDYLTQARMNFTGLDIDPFLRLTKIEGLTAHSSIQGNVVVSGPLKEPKRLNGEASVSQLAVSLAGVALKSDGALHAVLNNGVLSLDPLRVTGEDTNLRAKGSINIAGHGDLDFHANGEVNLKLAQTFNPDIASSGRVDFTLDAGGTMDRPDLSGQVTFTNGAVALQDLPNGLSQISGTLQFNQDRLDVKNLTAQTGGGQLKIGGYITYLQGLYGDLTASGTNIRIRYPTGVSSVADATLRLQGSAKNLLLSGNVQVTRFAINPNLDIAGIAGSTTAVAPPIDPNAPSNHVRLDVHITSAPALSFQNSFAKLAGDVDLRVRGTVASPSVLGRVNVTEGSANFAGTQYQLQHGDIFFTNPVRIDPTIDLDATARVENYDITIGLHGTANKLNVSYRSEPPLPQADVIALLALGRTQEEQGMVTQQQQNEGTNSTTNALLGGALNATVSSRVQKLFGVGSVKIDPTFVGSLGNSTARITVEQQVSKDVIITYATNVNSTAQQLIQAQVNLTRNVSVVALRDENGVFSTVVKVHRRYR